MRRINVQLAFRRRSLGHLTVIRATESLALELAVSFDLARSRALAASQMLRRALRSFAPRSLVVASSSLTLKPRLTRGAKVGERGSRPRTSCEARGRLRCSRSSSHLTALGDRSLLVTGGSKTSRIFRCSRLSGSASAILQQLPDARSRHSFERRSRAPLGRSRIARPQLTVCLEHLAMLELRSPCARASHTLQGARRSVCDPLAQACGVRSMHLAMPRSSTGGSRSSHIFRCGKVVCSSRSPRASFDAKAGSSAARDLRAPYGARRSSAARDPRSHLAVRRGSSAARDPLSPCGNREVVCGLRLHSRSKICGRSLRTVVFATTRDRRQIFTLEVLGAHRTPRDARRSPLTSRSGRFDLLRDRPFNPSSLGVRGHTLSILAPFGA